jgi:two-component system, NtrC family, sensor histidine kinase HydH
LALPESTMSWIKVLRPQDVLLVVLFAGLAAASPTRDADEIVMLGALAAVQIAGPKIPALGTTRGTVLWIVLELLLAYVLIGHAGRDREHGWGVSGLTSNYLALLLLPMISAATYLGVVGSWLITLLCCGVWASFLLFVNFEEVDILPDQARILVMWTLLLAVAGNLVNVLAEALRVQSAKYRKAVEELTEANRNLSQAEAAVRRSDRLAALGQLSAGLAHELRNPLGTIRASAEMLSRSVPADNEVAREVAGFIASEVDRSNSLVTRFLDFARPMQLKLVPSDLAEVLDRAVVLVERDTPQHRVTFYKNYSPDLAPFPFDAELMERVFYNLLLNAAQASDEGGAITLKTRRLDGTAEVAVIDRGPGIDPKIREQIFNPFFTTKSDGVGLGLAIVSKIVDEHGGRMAVESEPGRGSVFRVLLPMQPKT